jgi:type II secretory pathway pseudopilin PulG
VLLARERRAFTIVEMIVVIGIIVLILVIGVPAFNSMTVQQRASKTRQLLNGTLLRTQVVSVSDQTLTAVRLFPADWHVTDQDLGEVTAGRQIMTTYSFRSTYAANPYDPTQVLFDERFERIEDGPTHVLPPDTWVAPSEALDTVHTVPYLGGYVGDWVLNGRIGYFTLDADSRTNSGEQLLDADDFLIVFDPETGVQSSRRRQAWRLKAFDPRPAGEQTGQLETDGVRRSGTGQLDVPFQRFNFTGAVIYRREPFTALGADANDNDMIRARRDVLRRFGQAYYVDRTGGNLVAGTGEGGED